MQALNEAEIYSLKFSYVYFEILSENILCLRYKMCFRID